MSRKIVLVVEEKKPKNKKPLSQGAQQAKKRPEDYRILSPSEQWEIDKGLGILDWDGK